MKIIAFVFTFFIASNIFVFSQETESIATSEVVASSEVPVEAVAEAVATAEIVIIYTKLNSGIEYPIDVKTIHTNTLMTVVTTNMDNDPSRDFVLPKMENLTLPNLIPINAANPSP